MSGEKVVPLHDPLLRIPHCVYPVPDLQVLGLPRHMIAA